jgi:TRAP-type C4-dicarboxylate transport system permease small subunit
VNRSETQKSFVSRFIGWLSELAGYASGVLILASMLIICYGVFLRYVLGVSTVWQTELAIYFLMFAAFVGGAYGLKHGDHVKIDVVVDRLPGRVRLFVNFVAVVLSLLFIAIIGVLSFDLWWEAVERGRRSSTAWNIPLAYPYFMLPLGMALMALQYLLIAAEILRKFISGETGGPILGEGEDMVEETGVRASDKSEGAAEERKNQ